MALRIRKFDSTSIKESRIIFIIGKRHTGKSVLMKDLLYHMPRADFVLAMAPTEDSLKVFRSFLPESCIFDHFSQEKLERTVTLQRELVNRGKKRTVLIILDDCLYQKGVLKSNAMRSIFFNGRHDHISLICAAQYLMDIEPSLRSNIDYLFSMRENVLINRQKMYKNYFGHFQKYDDFDKVMTACTQDYKALVLDGTVSTTDSATDCVLWYKADPAIPKFRLCKSIYWGFAKRYCMDETAIRRLQQRQFEVQTATQDVLPDKKPSGGIQLVQTEDENGNVIS